MYSPPRLSIADWGHAGTIGPSSTRELEVSSLLFAVTYPTDVHTEAIKYPPAANRRGGPAPYPNGDRLGRIRVYLFAIRGDPPSELPPPTSTASPMLHTLASPTSPFFVGCGDESWTHRTVYQRASSISPHSIVELPAHRPAAPEKPIATTMFPSHICSRCTWSTTGTISRIWILTSRPRLPFARVNFDVGVERDVNTQLHCRRRILRCKQPHTTAGYFLGASCVNTDSDLYRPATLKNDEGDLHTRTLEKPRAPVPCPEYGNLTNDDN
ncbi:hypothetical protein DFH06DRAFT_1144921 [Mycena polygramma]|nr:hypothetical protein DFH06DRAFT_1144921 [Mycena polygramma]